MTTIHIERHVRVWEGDTCIELKAHEDMTDMFFVRLGAGDGDGGVSWFDPNGEGMLVDIKHIEALAHASLQLVRACKHDKETWNPNDQRT